MNDTDSLDVPATTPELEGELELNWLEPPSLLVLRHPVDLHLRLSNISRRTLDITHSRDATITLLSADGTSTVAGTGGFSALGKEARMPPGDSVHVIADGHFGHDGSARGHPSSGNYLLVAELRVGVQPENDWRYRGGVVVSRAVPITLRVLPARGESS
ncbi:hypothetical protein [Frankia sp. R82]|uniref:hypothetical protein n=1 Tax=Frankia sp. R82 TaxID=2950553 RepID=UPI0020433DD5|nr:hypothetical protein [Frankia sp. R82]MCM3885621.1 hypothetical protein [Frankia sp. R82]